MQHSQYGNQSRVNNFYVYVYLDQDNTPFYVGKGRNNRYLIVHHLQNNCNNRFLKNKIRKVAVENVRIEFPLKNISEEDAFAYEELFIGMVGRRDQGKGPLCNLTDGGEGNSGYTHSDETRQKLSEIKKGKKFSEEHKRKLSDGQKGENHPMYGKHWPEKTRRKMAGAKKGEKNPMYGKNHTKKAKQKMRNAWKRRKAQGEGDDYPASR
ncbi:hypothetical protein LCGC14_1707440 [marine sediment metagenome]|uniref:GIY-YIG domain-containing protein n=1 Tax=marine sediment metagenome TaxID=412755 RepID=A0A0F9KG98_9ZZZZ